MIIPVRPSISWANHIAFIIKSVHTCGPVGTPSTHVKLRDFSYTCTYVNASLIVNAGYGTAVVTVNGW